MKKSTLAEILQKSTKSLDDAEVYRFVNHSNTNLIIVDL